MEKYGFLLYSGCIVLALAAGGVMALQPAINGRLASQCSHPLQASVISFGSGFLALLMVCLVLRTGLPDFGQLKNLPAWAWTGGLCGSYMVTVSLLLAPQMGAVRWIALVLAGQIALSLVLDHFGWIGYSQHRLTWTRFFGIALVVAGVLVVMRN